MVDVEHGGLTGLEQDGLTGVEGLVEDQRAVDDHGAHALGVGQQIVGDGVGVDGGAVEDLEEQAVLLVQGGVDLLAQDRLVEEVLDPDAHAVHLVRVGGADAPAGGAQPALAQEALGSAVQHPVVGGDEVGGGGDPQGGGVPAAGDDLYYICPCVSIV